MINILIIEDSQTKLKKIIQSINRILSPNIPEIDHVIDSHEAKKLLTYKLYHLLILDIAIPPRKDLDVVHDEGIKLFSEIVDREQYITPMHAIGLTAYKDIIKSHKALANFKMVHFDDRSDSFEIELKLILKHIISFVSSQQREPDQYKSDLCVVCALKSPELDNILSNGWEWKRIINTDDPTLYYQSEINIKDKKLLAYAAHAPHMGMPFSSVIISKMITKFRPKFLAMTGIAAGVRGRVSICDIVAASPIWDWGSGKWKQKEDEHIFLQEPYPYGLDEKIIGKLETMISDNAIQKICAEWKGLKPEETVKLHIGPMVSGSCVVSSQKIIDFIELQHRKIVALDMEGYSVFCTCENFSYPKPYPIVIKSIVDFGDNEKSDDYHNYGSYLSAQILKILFESYLIEQ